MFLFRLEVQEFLYIFQSIQLFVVHTWDLGATISQLLTSISNHKICWLKEEQNLYTFGGNLAKASRQLGKSQLPGLRYHGRHPLSLLPNYRAFNFHFDVACGKHFCQSDVFRIFSFSGAATEKPSKSDLHVNFPARLDFLAAAVRS